MSQSPDRPPGGSSASVPKWRDPATAAAVGTVTQVLIAAAAGWFLLQQLAPILRPLLIAVFLAYVVMPYHSRLRKHIGSPASIIVLAAATAALLVALGVAVYLSVLALSDDMPRLQERMGELFRSVENMTGHADDGKPIEAKLNEQMAKARGPLLGLAADVLLEACVVALYLMFLLLEGSRLPDRVRRAYSRERAHEILQIAGQVSEAIISYLRAKIWSSLVLAVPVGVVLLAVGVKFWLLWGVLAFLCNFIPYIGSVVSYSLPVGFALLWFGPTWQPVVAAALLMVIYVFTSAVTEPLILGNAVGLSPLIILVSLAFWGLLWGISGMFLAVPLTVVSVIVLDHFESTRPVARLFRGG